MEVALLIGGALLATKALQTKGNRSDDGKPLRNSEAERVALANSRRANRYIETDVRAQTYARDDKLSRMPDPFIFRNKLSAPHGTEQEFRYWTATPLSDLDPQYKDKRTDFKHAALYHGSPNHVFKDRHSRRGYHSEELSDNPDQKFVRTIYA